MLNEEKHEVLSQSPTLNVGKHVEVIDNVTVGVCVYPCGGKCVPMCRYESMCVSMWRWMCIHGGRHAL